MASNTTLTIYLGANEDGKQFLERINKATAGKPISPFIKACIEKELKALGF